MPGWRRSLGWPSKSRAHFPVYIHTSVLGMWEQTRIAREPDGDEGRLFGASVPCARAQDSGNARRGFKERLGWSFLPVRVCDYHNIQTLTPARAMCPPAEDDGVNHLVGVFSRPQYFRFYLVPPYIHAKRRKSQLVSCGRVPVVERAHVKPRENLQ